MLYFSNDFGELTLDGLIDTGAHSSAIPEADLRQIRLLAPQFVVKKGPPHLSNYSVANGDLETPKSTVELKYEVGDIEFHESFIVMVKLSSHNRTDNLTKKPHSPRHAPRYIKLSLFFNANEDG